MTGENLTKLLIVDDEERVLTLLKVALSDCGFNIDLTHDGKEAIEKINIIDFDLVLTVFNMPGASGLEVAEAAKKKNPDIQVIILTGYAELNTVITALRLGISDFIQKPIHINFLLNSINKCIEHKKIIDENLKLTANLKEKNVELEKALATIEKQHKIILHNEMYCYRRSGLYWQQSGRSSN